MYQRLFSLAIIFSVLLSCSRPSVENPSYDFEPAQKLAKLKGKTLEEISGIAASKNNPGLLWGHNDSANGTEVFLFDDKLRIVLTCELKGVVNRDWEDIAVGPGPDSTKSYIYIGEIGDNDAVYQYKAIYRFEEPTLADGVTKLDITAIDKITFQLPDKKKDTESLLLDPKTKDLYIISKREEPVWVYKLAYPQSTTDTLTATKVISLPLTQIVGGDFSLDGSKLLIKNYEHIYYWNNEADKAIEELLAEKPFEVKYELEPQGEAITFAHDNRGFYTISEKNIGKDSYLYFYAFKEGKSKHKK